LQGLDTSVYRSGLRMMGSSKKKNISRIYKPFNNQDGTISVNDMYDNSLLIHKLSIKLPAPVKKNLSILPNKYKTISNGFDFSNIHINYKNTHVTHIFKRRDEYIIQTKEHFCTNIDREHKNNHIYFVVTKNKKIYQKCYCTCFETKCNSFVGKEKPVSIKLFYSLKNHL
jgi:hypothetical protein